MEVPVLKTMEGKSPSSSEQLPDQSRPNDLSNEHTAKIRGADRSPLGNGSNASKHRGGFPARREARLSGLWVFVPIVDRAGSRGEPEGRELSRRWEEGGGEVAVCSSFFFSQRRPAVARRILTDAMVF